MIELSVNGEKKQLAQTTTVASALEQWGYSGGDIAVAVNGEFVPRSSYPERKLVQSDCIDIVAPIQGG